ncbi:MAG TPA: hypothetical protein VJP76_01230 [Candidatus Tumulicola sp.]|nr:hypothetical protein [Candidatus Tumulicola sp.]
MRTLRAADGLPGHARIRWAAVSTVIGCRRLAALLAFGLAALPAASPGSCRPGAAPSYDDISSVYFQSSGLSEPIAIHRGARVEPGACPIRVTFYVSRSDVRMGGSPVCIETNESVYQCCGASASQTGDSPQIVFDRVVAVLKRDRFYSLAASPQTALPDGAAFYRIAVMRCGAPRPMPNTSILTLRIPFGSTPETLYDPNLVKLFGDLTHAIYESKWTRGDVW